jgi:hypothetical protein
LSIGIPDSGFLSHDKKARSRRDGVNSLLKEKAAELSRFVVSCFLRLVYLIIDAHRLKSRGEGCSNFCQNTGGGGGQSFQEKLPREVPPISGFSLFLLTSLYKFACGVLYLPSPFPLTPRVHLWLR